MIKSKKILLIAATVGLLTTGILSALSLLPSNESRAPEPPPENNTAAIPAPKALVEVKRDPGRLELSPHPLALSSTLSASGPTTAVEGEIAVANMGGEGIKVLEIRHVGDPSVVVVNGPDCQKTIAGGDTCVIRLSWHPHAAGTATSSLMVKYSQGEGNVGLVTGDIQTTTAPPPAPPVDEEALRQAFAQRLRAQGATSGEQAYDANSRGQSASNASASPSSPQKSVETEDGDVHHRDGAAASVENHARLVSLVQDDYGKDFPAATMTLPVCLDRIILAGSSIPLVMDSRVNSEQCPGTVKAHVAFDVLSSSGDRVILPHGSKVLGTCGKVGGSETRVPIKFTRITRLPDGATVAINEQGGDRLGGLGVPGKLYDRAADKLQAALEYSAVDGVVSALGAAASQAQGTSVSTSGGVTVVKSSPLATGAAAAVNSGSSNTSQVIKSLIDQSSKAGNVVIVEYGDPASILVSKDIRLSALPDGLDAGACSDREMLKTASGKTTAANPTSGHRASAVAGSGSLDSDVSTGELQSVRPGAERLSGETGSSNWRGRGSVEDLDAADQPAGKKTGSKNSGSNGKTSQGQSVEDGPPADVNGDIGPSPAQAQ